MKLHGWIVAALTLPAAPCLAATCPNTAAWPDDPGRIVVRMDNDAFGNASQDHNYSNGMILAMTSADLASRDDACLSLLPRLVSRYANWVHRGDFDQLNLVADVTHGIYTPDDKTRSDLIEDDRPYAGVLMFGLGYNARLGTQLRTTQLRLGMVGPSAKGQTVQNLVHEVIDVRRAQGWSHQLRDEPLLQLLHERLRRRPFGASRLADGWGLDAIGHAGASLGNFTTYANAGMELRFGLHLPDDFGSDPQRPAGEHTGSRQGYAARTGWGWHAFMSVDARAVAYDITLDGNTSKSSHSVDRRPFVGDLGYGLVVTRGRWQLTFAQYQRSREFDGQTETPSFGSLSVSRMF